jgi:hypothetical protein
VSLSIRDCELTARFQMPLSGFNERSTKLASKHLSIGQTGKAPTAIPLASTMLMHLMRLYAQAGVEIIHGHLAHAAYRPSNLDDIREF